MPSRRSPTPTPSDRPGRGKAVVIGSGFGGLAAAIRLRAKGYDTTILEMRDKPGGRAYVYEDQGFVFDAGPTIITVPFVLDELAELAGQAGSADYVTIVPCDPYYRIYFHDGRTFDYVGDNDRLEAEIARFNPDDVAGYRGVPRLQPPASSTGRSPTWPTTRSTRSGRWSRSPPT